MKNITTNFNYNYSQQSPRQDNDRLNYPAVSSPAEFQSGSAEGVRGHGGIFRSNNPLDIDDLRTDVMLSAVFASSTTWNSSSYTTNVPGQFILVIVCQHTAPGTQTVTISGGGLTWGQIKRSAVQTGAVEMWGAYSTNILSAATITATWSAATVGTMTIVSFLNADASASVGNIVISSNSATTQPLGANLTAFRDRSWFWGGGVDWTAATARTLLGNQVKIKENVDAGTGDTDWIQCTQQLVPERGVNVRLGTSAPNTITGNFVACEVQPSLNAGTQTNYVIARDSFTDANGTALTAHKSDTNHTWTTQPSSSGDGQIQSNTLQSNLSANPYVYSSAIPYTAEYDVTIKCKSTGSCGGPSGRLSTAAQTGYAVLYNAGGANRWELHQIVATVDTTLQTFTGLVPTTQRLVTLRIRNLYKSVIVDGQEIMVDFSNAVPDRGRPGLNMSGDGNEIMDDWSVTNT